MFVFLSKLLPLLVYPLGMACILLVASLVIRRYPRLRTTLVILALALLWLGSNRWVSYSLARSLEWQYLPMTDVPAVDAIIVLGGGTEPALYPRPAVEVNSAGDRVLYAARLYKEGKAPHILVSGGSITYLREGEDTSTPAAEMADILRLVGVPGDAIWVQDSSLNTRDDAVLSVKMLKEQGISRALLVTSALHMPRSVALFRQLGFDVIPAPTDYTVTQEGWDAMLNGSPGSWLINLLPNTSTLNITTNVLKEYFGLLVYHMRGWL